MSRAKIKKKNMFIDMTAMSDVTVLLLTFFMLTASFVKKEPVQVVTPASISEIKIPETNIMSILVDPGTLSRLHKRIIRKDIETLCNQHILS